MGNTLCAKNLCDKYKGSFENPIASFCQFNSCTILVSPTLIICRIDHFTVVCFVAWPLNESETGVDLVLIETSLLFLR